MSVFSLACSCCDGSTELHQELFQQLAGRKKKNSKRYATFIYEMFKHDPDRHCWKYILTFSSIPPRLFKRSNNTLSNTLSHPISIFTSPKQTCISSFAVSGEWIKGQSWWSHSPQCWDGSCKREREKERELLGIEMKVGDLGSDADKWFCYSLYGRLVFYVRACVIHGFISRHVCLFTLNSVYVTVLSMSFIFFLWDLWGLLAVDNKGQAVKRRCPSRRDLLCNHVRSVSLSLSPFLQASLDVNVCCGCL